LLHSNAAVLLQDQIAYSANLSQIISEPERVWRAIMDEWSLSPSTIAVLPLKEVMRLRESSVGKKARCTFARLMDLARVGAVTTETAETARESLLSLLSEEIRRQKTAHRRWNAGGTVLSVAGWVTSGIGTACGKIAPDTSVALGILSFFAGAPIVGAVEKRIGSTEIILLADAIRRRAHIYTRNSRG
jgi:hypothetical protein